MEDNKPEKKFDDQLDEAVSEPKAKTEQELLQNPLDLLDDEKSQTLEDQQRKLDESWQVGVGEPKIGHDATLQPPGSGANEGRGRHDSSINDNDSKNGPAR